MRMPVVALAVLLTLFAEPAACGDTTEPESLTSASCFESIPIRVMRKIKVPSGYHEGLYLEGKDIWLANGEKGAIWVIDLATGATIATIEPLSTFTEGITRGADGYYVTDWDEKKLYKARLSDGRLVATAEVSFEPSHPAGVVWAGKRLFAVTWTRGMGTKFDLVELDAELRILRRYRINRIQEPSQLAWDGKHLWISSWYSRLVYKVDVDAMRILGSFRSPVELTTGIAWDGSFLWLTGTHGDLYQLEIGP